MNHKLMFGSLVAAAAALLVLGCTSGGGGTTPFNPDTAQHPANWTDTHYAAYLENPTSCVPCHGSATDMSAPVGTSGVSCFGCHHPVGPNHPAGWSDFSQHGLLGAQAAYNSAPFSMQGMASCTVCHGTDFKTGIGTTESCYSCHTTAPHPPKPWGAGSNDSASLPNHDTTDPSNVPVCYTCHAAGGPVNTTLNTNPTTPAAPNATPGCFNNTMCHGIESGTP